MNKRIYNIETIYCQILNFYDRNILKDMYNKLNQSNIFNLNTFVERSITYLLRTDTCQEGIPNQLIEYSMFMNEYIHQEQANIIYLNQDKQAQRILQNVIQSENICAQGLQPQNALFQYIQIENEGVKQECIMEKIEEKIEEKLDEKIEEMIDNMIQEKIQEKIEDIQNISKEIKIDQVQLGYEEIWNTNQFSKVDKEMMNPIIENCLHYANGMIMSKGHLGLNEEIRVLGYRFKFFFSTLKILLCENIGPFIKDNIENETTIDMGGEIEQ
ncbi:hypothetical protein pb186bvf_008974 [Paramecium bursaria]